MDWLGLGGMERHDLRSSTPSYGCGWVGVSQIGELRRPFVSSYGSGMTQDVYMINQDFL